MPASGGGGERKGEKKKKKNKRALRPQLLSSRKRNRSPYACALQRGLEIHICCNHPLSNHRWKLRRWKTIFIYLYIFLFAPLDEYLTRPSFICHGKLDNSVKFARMKKGNGEGAVGVQNTMCR